MFKSYVSAVVNPAPPTNSSDAKKQALLSVVQVWLDRLSSMSVVTTFFLSVDSMLYSFGARPDSDSATDTLIVASLGGAIILHICASILAYCGSFVLIRYRLNDAENTERAAETADVAQPTNPDNKQYRSDIRLAPGSTLSAAMSPSELIRDAYIDLRSLISVDQIHPFSFVPVCTPSRKANLKKPDPEAAKDDDVEKLRSMVRMLTRCHTVAAVETVLGFILALLGTLAYFWTGLSPALGIFASAILGACLVAGGIAVI